MNKCTKCGAELITTVLPSNPPQYKEECPTCQGKGLGKTKPLNIYIEKGTEGSCISTNNKGEAILTNKTLN